MDSSALASAELWLTWIGRAKLIAAFLVAAGVAIEFVGDWASRPYEKTVKDARDEEAEFARTSIVKAQADIADANKQTEIAKKDAAIAEQHANEAKLALEKLRTPRTMDRDWQSAITAQLLPFKGVRFDIAVIPGDPEATDLLSQVVPPIQAAGWQWIDFSPAGGPLTITFSWPGLPNVGQMGGFGIDVFAPPDRSDLSPAATALAESPQKRWLLQWDRTRRYRGAKIPQSRRNPLGDR